MFERRDEASSEASVALGANGRHVRTAHGFIMAIVFIGLKPAGAILLRVLSGKLAFRLHVGWQLFAWCCAFTGVGLGIWLANTMNRFGKQHPIIGFVVVAGMLVQPALGWVHHIVFLKTKRPTWMGTAHVWLGRLVIMLGIINGGIGLSDADNSWPSEIAYIVLAGTSFAAYLALLALVAYKGRKALGREGVTGGTSAEVKRDDEGLA